MKVGELKKLLGVFDDNYEVCLAYPSGDYWGTTLAREVTDACTETVTFSSYHNTNKLVDEEKIQNYELDELKSVVILS